MTRRIKNRRFRVSSAAFDPVSCNDPTMAPLSHHRKHCSCKRRASLFTIPQSLHPPAPWSFKFLRREEFTGVLNTICNLTDPARCFSLVYFPQPSHCPIYPLSPLSYYSSLSLSNNWSERSHRLGVLVVSQLSKSRSGSAKSAIKVGRPSHKLHFHRPGHSPLPYRLPPLHLFLPSAWLPSNLQDGSHHP